MHVSNPFTAGKRREARDQAVMDKHYTEREQREATRREAFRSQQRQAEYQRDMNGNPIRPSATSAKNLAERSKYQFEADSEDDEMENEIEGNLDLLHGAAGRLGQLGRAMGREVDEQNKHIDRITGKVSRFVDSFVAVGNGRVRLIRECRRIRSMTRLLSTVRGWTVSSRSNHRDSSVLQGLILLGGVGRYMVSFLIIVFLVDYCRVDRQVYRSKHDGSFEIQNSVAVAPVNASIQA